MTTINPAVKTQCQSARIRFPDPPERRPEDMTTFNHLAVTGSAYLLIHHLGNPDTTIVAGEHYVALAPTTEMKGLRYPDLLIAFNVDPDAYRESNAYVISEQGKPPDFVLEIVSPSSRRRDRVTKRQVYAGLGIPEYWRFDETDGPRRIKLAGDRLTADGQYRPIPIERLADGTLQGYSAVLNLYLRWEEGQLRWHDPATGQHIVTLEDERARADYAETRADYAETRADYAETRAGHAETRADYAETRAGHAETRADYAEARARELEAELRRLRGQ